MQQYLDMLFNAITPYMHNKDDLNFIEKALKYAYEKHDGQVRKSGEAYISHPVEVALILTKLKVGPYTLAAALLHDVVEDTDATLEDVKELFGEDISNLVEGLTKVSKLKFTSLAKHQVENHQKMLLAMGKDIRVIVIKLADRLHNMRTLDFMPNDKQIRISHETLEIYAPLAHKLGMFRIKGELEDKSLRYIEPDIYQKISNLTSEKMNHNDAVNELMEKIKGYLTESNVSGFEIKGRVKNTYSIYKKMYSQEKAFEDIYDILAIRVIVDKIETCYQTLGLVHAHYTPVPRRFKDYIAVPKQNLYQSLHTTIIGPQGETFEIQIRTKDMDQVAEYGIAAHWGYKENASYSKEREQYEIAQKLKWYADILQLADDESNLDLVETIKGDILDANVYVYTPKGEVIPLSKGATPLDFAYKIHTDLGHKTTGAIVNNKIVPLTYEMKTGDIISLKTSNIASPSESWLKIVKTNYARHKIKTFLNKQNKEKLIIQGKAELERELQSIQRERDELTEEFVKKHFSKNNINSIEELYNEIGKGTLSCKTVEQKLYGIRANDKEVILQRQIEKSNKILTTNSDTGVVVEGLSNPQIKLASCCSPIPEDKIIGYVSKGQGLIVHKEGCSNSKMLESDRFLSLQWATNINRKYPVKIKITSLFSKTILTEVITTINAQGFNLASVNSTTNANLETIIKLKILVSSVTDLNLLLVNIQKISDITGISRI